MARGFKPEMTRKNEDFIHAVKVKMAEHNISRAKLMQLTGVSVVTMTNRIGKNANPDKMTVQELRIYCKALKLPDDVILDFVRG